MVGYMRPLALLNYSIVSFAFLAILITNAFAWQSSLLGVVLLTVFLFFFGHLLHERLALGIATLLASVSILGAIAYYLFELTPLASLIIIFLVILAVPFLQHRDSAFPKLPNFLISKSVTILPATILFIATVSLLLNTQILTPVRSPWLVIPPVFFLVVFLFSLFTVASRSKLLFVALFFLTISVALFVYPLGYGFDSFIHQATEQHIVENGTITPKPLYYVGQYAIIVIATNLFSIPVDVSDSFLLPLLATLLLAPIILISFKRINSAGRGNTAFGVFAIFLIPLSSFIVTTPQSLANFWVLLVILSSLIPGRNFLPSLFTIAAIVTHPLSGIPAMLFLLISRSVKQDKSCYRSFWPLVGIGAIIMPILFVANSLISGQAIAFHPENLFPLPLFEMLRFDFFFENRFNALKDLVYLFGWNQTLIVLIMGIIGYRIAKKNEDLHALRLFGLISILMLVNYILLDRLFEFSFLIEYERSNYADRLLQLAQFFALPLVGLTLTDWSRRLFTKPLAIKVGAVGLTAIVLTSVVYMTYPRHDNYEISRGFNVGTSDFATVEYIHGQQEPGMYIVLANQAVSAAALKTYGFETYFNGDVFYYPIPTGGAMYELYLKMVNLGPTHQRAVEAMDLAGVDTAYFVVNDYWFLADKIIENAKREADDWVVIDNGATTVFEFQR